MMPRIDMVKTGYNIIRLRENAGLTVRDVQMVFGFNNVQTVYKWQRGESLPTIDNLVVLARLFGVSMDEIVAVEDDA